MKFITSTAIITLTCSASLAQDVHTSKLTVYVQQQCANDTVGQRLAFKIRESLNLSTYMTAVDSHDSSVIQINLGCLEPETKNRGSVSHYSYAITLLNLKGHYDFLLRYGIGTCGSLRIAECAESIIADVDEAVSKLRTKIKDGSFEWPN